MAKTTINAAAMRKAAKKIGELMDGNRIQVFADLAGMKLEAGALDTSAWLEDRVLDRRVGLHLYALELQAAFYTLSDMLVNVADAFESGDKDGSFETSVAEEFNAWIDTVLEAAPGPAVFEQAHDGGYDSKDTGNPDGAYVSYEYDANGKPKTNSDGKVVIHLPASSVPTPGDVGDLINNVESELDPFAKSHGVKQGEKWDGGFWSPDELTTETNNPA